MIGVRSPIDDRCCGTNPAPQATTAAATTTSHIAVASDVRDAMLPMIGGPIRKPQ
jgi:hypothetical protein